MGHVNVSICQKSIVEFSCEVQFENDIQQFDQCQIDFHQDEFDTTEKKQRIHISNNAVASN